MSTPTDHDGPTKDHSAGSQLSRSDTEHAAQQHIADKSVPEHGAGAPPAEPSSPPQVDPPAKPIAETPPVSPTSDDDDFVPRGKVTQTLAGGGKKGGTRPR